MSRRDDIARALGRLVRLGVIDAWTLDIDERGLIWRVAGGSYRTGQMKAWLRGAELVLDALMVQR